MNYTEIVTEVYTLTGRPDLVDRTAAAVRAATLKMHHTDFYAKDIVEVGLDFGAAATLQTFDYRATFTRWRALAYLRKVDSTSLEPLDPPLSVLTHDNVLDSYAVEKEDVCYEAGQNLQIRCRDQIQYFLCGYYQNPSTASDSYDSWIALAHPYAIVFDAAATVFKTIGYDEQAREYRALVAEQIAMLKTSNIQPVGY